MRLVAFSIAGKTLDNRAWPLIERVIHLDGDHWPAIRAISKCLHPREAILNLLRNESLELRVREYIAKSVTHILKIDEERVSFIRDCSQDLSLAISLRCIMLLFSARFSDEQAFRLLVGDLATIDHRFAVLTISLFGHYPLRDLGIAAAAVIRDRVTNAQEAADFADRAVLGMTYIFEMDSFGGGALMPAPPHPALDAWANLIDGWMDLNGASEIQRLTIAVSAVRLGSMRAIDQLKRLIYALGDPDDSRFDDEDEYGHKIRSAIDELQRRRLLLPLCLAERFTRCKRPNIPFAGVNAIVAHGNRAALDLLINIYNDPSTVNLESTLLEVIEPIAGRLNVIVVLEDERLQII